jgi:hypothetical protein
MARPIKPALPGTKAKLSVNVPATTKTRIDAASRSVGCDQGEEINRRLLWSFDFEDRMGGPQVLNLLTILADVAKTKYPESDWFDVRDRYLAIRQLWIDALDAFIPPRPDAAQILIDIARALIAALTNSASDDQERHLRRVLGELAETPGLDPAHAEEFRDAASPFGPLAPAPPPEPATE